MQGKPLWSPSAKRVEDAQHALASPRRCANATREGVRLLTRSGSGPSATSRNSGPRCGTSRRDRRQARRTRAGAGRQDARRALLPRREAQLRREPPARKAATRRRDRLLGRGQGEAAPHAPRAARRGLAHAAGARRGRRERGRSRRRLHAQHAGDDRRDARHGEPRRRRSPRARRTSASRACSTASARSSPRCSSRATATSTTARPSTRCRASREIVKQPADGEAGRDRALRQQRGPTRPLVPRRRACDGLPRALQGEGDRLSRAMPFNHPLYILYSSGTTGVPKCIVHGAGGVLLMHLKEHMLHCDVKPGDRVFYFTTCGWMMWNWLVSGARRRRHAAALRRLAVHGPRQHPLRLCAMPRA